MYAHYQLFSLEAAHKRTGLTPSSLHASIANRVSYVFNFRGPSIALDTMCSSSLTAIHLACASLAQRECEVAIAGGVNLSLHPNKYVALGEAGFTSSDGHCRSFGEGGDGYVPGEGVGALLLKPLSTAIADGDHIYGVIKASAINHGGRTNGYTVPNPAAQGEVIAEALRKAKLDPRRITCLEAHGTGTSLGDPIEITGLVKAFHEVGNPETANDRQYCSIGSVKSNIGHLESAAGIAGVTKVLLQMKHRQLVPSIHSQSLNPHINFTNTPFFVQQRPAPWKRQASAANDGHSYPRLAGISSFGAGGANVHVLVEEYEQTDSLVDSTLPKPQVVPLSARTEERLKIYAGRMAEFLSGSTGRSAINPNEDLLERIQGELLNIAGSILNLDPQEIDPTEETASYSIDPVCLVAMGERVNEKFQIELNAAAFTRFPRLQALAQHIAKRYQDDMRRHYQLAGPVEGITPENQLEPRGSGLYATSRS